MDSKKELEKIISNKVKITLNIQEEIQSKRDFTDKQDFYKTMMILNKNSINTFMY